MDLLNSFAWVSFLSEINSLFSRLWPRSVSSLRILTETNKPKKRRKSLRNTLIRIPTRSTWSTTVASFRIVRSLLPWNLVIGKKWERKKWVGSWISIRSRSSGCPVPQSITCPWRKSHRLCQRAQGLRALDLKENDQSKNNFINNCARNA